jgi:hypothetical protein
MSNGYATGHADTIDDLLDELRSQIQRATANRCAAVCERAGMEGYGTIAAAIMIREEFGCSPIPNGNTKW